MPKQYIERAGSMKVNGIYIAVYRMLQNIRCAKCGARIEPGELVIRGSKRIYKPNKFLAGCCVNVKIDVTDYNKDPLNFFTGTNAWFLNYNGDALELLERITKACGYSELKKNLSYASMVGWHIEKYYSKVLAERFFCLLNKASEEFPVIRSEAGATFENMFGE